MSFLRRPTPLAVRVLTGSLAACALAATTSSAAATAPTTPSNHARIGAQSEDRSSSTSPTNGLTRVSTSQRRLLPGVDNQGSVLFDPWDSPDWNVPGIYDVGTRVDCDYGTVAFFHNYFFFDLSDIEPGTATRAWLVLRRGETRGGGIYQLRHVRLAPEAFHRRGYLYQGGDAYTDLADGRSYGDFSLVDETDPDDLVRLRLNRYAVSEINRRAGGWFTVGGSLSGDDPDCLSGASSEYMMLFYGTSSIGKQRLVIKTG